MPAIVEGRASDLSIPAARRSPAVPALLGGSGVLLVAAVLLGDATDEARLAWIGAGAVVVVAVAALVLPRPRVGRAGVALFALVAAATAWAAISVLWSIQPDRSWDVVNRGLAYMALLGLGALVAAATPRAARLTAGAFAVVFGAAIVWALAGKAVPALGSDLERVARLQSPLGYWNALALLIAMSLPLWLWVAAPPSRSRVLRAAGCAAIALAVAALALTASRGGILVAVVAVGAWLALVGLGVESGLVLVAGGVPGAAAAGWALTRPALTEAGSLARGRDGALLGVALVVAAGVAAVVGARLPAVSGPGRRKLGVVLALVALAVAVAAVAAVTVHVGGPREFVQQFRDPGEQADASRRILSVSASSRWTWWEEAARIWRDHPVRGTGAGTFELARKPFRPGTASPTEPHDLPLQALSETGVIGLVLLLAVVAAAARVVRDARRRLRSEDALAAAALTAGAVAYLAHSLIDTGVDFVAVTAPVLLGVGVLAAAGRPAGPPVRSPVGVLAVAAVGVAVVASLAAPRIAERRTDQALDALLAGDPARARSLARDGHALNPLSVEPLFREAAAERQLGRYREARRLYEQAVKLQPENAETWYALGTYVWDVGGDAKAAVPYLERSWALDKYGPAQHRLEQAKAAARAGG